MIDKQHLSQAFPLMKDDILTKYVPILNQQMVLYGINSTIRQITFLAQLFIESNFLSATVENLNYSADGLVSVFGKYFTHQANPTSNKEIAEQYARQPERIANIVYANRMGNGDINSGDGWLYRGRGLIQITGKSLYDQYGTYCKNDFLCSPELLEQPEHAVGSACWYWSVFKNLNSLADLNTLDSFTAITKKINGGTNGLPERTDAWNKLKRVYNIS